ncbi:PspA/IM30 family protein [Myxococcota bacterium]|nr:PspA/IM30 family protein [Myxococcota bacterium]
MGILSRISKVLESNLNALVDRAEDPAKMLDQAIEDMKKGRNEARQAIVEAKTQKRLFEKRHEKAAAEAAALEKKAMLALKSGDEGLARKCLELKIAADQRAQQEASACAEQDAQVESLVQAERELDRRLAEMPAKRAALLARQSVASAKGARAGQANKAADSVSNALEAFDRMEEKVIRAEVEAEMITETNPSRLLDSGALESYAADEALEALKAKMGMKELGPGTPQRKQLGAGDPVEDSLAAMKKRLGKDE